MVQQDGFEFGLSRAVPDDSRQELRGLLHRRAVCLASASPRRRAILKSCGIQFQVNPSHIEEPDALGPDWRRWVRRWSLRKALASNTRRGLVIGSDTIVVCRQRSLGKPRNESEALATLQRLSGRTHLVFSGVGVVNHQTGQWTSGSEATRVRFRKITRQEMVDYVRSGEPMDKAGAYGIQGGAAKFIAEINGPVDNVMGLPVGRLIQTVRRVL